MEITFKEKITTTTEVEHKKEIEFPYYSINDSGIYEILLSPKKVYAFHYSEDGGDFHLSTYKSDGIIKETIIKNKQISKEEFEDAIFELKSVIEKTLNKISPPPPAPSLMEQIKPIVEPNYEEKQ